MDSPAIAQLPGHARRAGVVHALAARGATHGGLPAARNARSKLTECDAKSMDNAEHRATIGCVMAGCRSSVYTRVRYGAAIMVAALAARHQTG